MAAMEAASVDAVVTDPPYGLREFPVKIIEKALTAWLSGDRDHVPDGRGFMSRDWDKFVPPPAVWDECYRVLKPGGWLLCFAAPRTQDLMGLSIRLAGFSVQDSAHWITGQGFPKAKSRLKPAHEPVIVARKAAALDSPFPGLDGCRVAHGSDVDLNMIQRQRANNPIQFGGAKPGDVISKYKPGGRWPPNVLLGPEAAAELDAQSGTCRSAGQYVKGSRGVGSKAGAASIPIDGLTSATYDDVGGASRYFPVFRYQAKAPRSERPAADGVKAHPTVKPVDLMRWLVRLVTPPGGLVLDPFAGTGTTGEACLLEGFRCVLIERDPDYVKLARARLGKPVQPQMRPGRASKGMSPAGHRARLSG